jgi:hypothetical protein
MSEAYSLAVYGMVPLPKNKNYAVMLIMIASPRGKHK